MEEKKKYSPIIKHDRKAFRYNYEDRVLEFLGYVSLMTDEIEVLDASGLQLENWEEDKMWWVEIYSEEIEQEIARLGSW